MKKVAVFGGSFSPVHRGHITVAKGVLKAGLADEVWMIPCKRNPLKDGSSTMDDNLRLRLLREAVEQANIDSPGEAGILVSELELSLPSPSYTIETMRVLRQRYPDVEFRIVMGADSYLEFDKWKDHDRLLEEFSPIVYPRPGYDTGKLPSGWTTLENAETVDISSTQLRSKK